MIVSTGTTPNPTAGGSPASSQELSAQVVGRVQGVGFRYYVQTAARRLGVTGWVKNERDGSVRVVAIGDDIRLKQLLHALHTGPSLAAVQNVSYEVSAATSTYPAFVIVHE
ncbi:MAG: acylphosphatase [Bacteroidota bacterium]